MGQHPPSAPWAWPAILAASTVVGSLAAACLMPFVALAVMAAATLPFRRAVLVVVAAWAFNQASGFGWMGYPLSASALGQGATLLAGALAAFAVARWLDAGSGRPLRLASAFGLGFAAYEAVLFAGAHLTGGLETFAPDIVAQVAGVEALWFVLLATLALALQRIAPVLAPPRPLQSA